MAGKNMMWKHRLFSTTLLFLFVLTTYVVIFVLCHHRDYHGRHIGSALGKSRGDRKIIDCPACLNNRWGDRRTDKSRLRLVAFNPEWLFTQGGHGAVKCPGRKCTWKTRSAGLAHLRRIAHHLGSLNADIIHLSEVEDCAVLKQLVSEMNGTDHLRPYMVRSGDAALGQNVALLTKIDPQERLYRSPAQIHYPLANSSCPKGQSGSTNVSKHYMARLLLAPPFLNVTIIGVHLIARPNSAARCAKREAQAALIRRLIDSAVPPGDEVIVMGDFNDYDEEVVGADRRRPLSPVLLTIKGGRRKEGRRLFNVAAKIPIENRFSAWWDVNGNCREDGAVERTLIDHVLVSEGLWEKVSSVFVAHGYPMTCRRGSRVSDHWPLVVDLVF